MKELLMYTFTFMSLFHAQEVKGAPQDWLDTEIKLHHVNPYKLILQKRSILNSQVCIPGATKRNECNNCLCSADGSGWSCSTTECLQFKSSSQGSDDASKNPDAVKNLRRVKRLLLTAGPCRRAMYMNECNHCWCQPDSWGGHYVCTTNPCPSTTPRTVA